MGKLIDRIRLASDLNKAIFLLLVFFFTFNVTHVERVGHWTEIMLGVVAMGLRNEFKAHQKDEADKESVKL